jgi:hypothetical protein
MVGCCFSGKFDDNYTDFYIQSKSFSYDSLDVFQKGMIYVSY